MYICYFSQLGLGCAIWEYCGIAMENDNPPVGDLNTLLVKLGVMMVLILIGGAVIRHACWSEQRTIRKRWCTVAFLPFPVIWLLTLPIFGNKYGDWLAAIKEFGIVRAAFIFIPVTAVGWIICCGPSLLPSLRANKTASYSGRDVLAKNRRNFEKLSDRALFPALFAASAGGTHTAVSGGTSAAASQTPSGGVLREKFEKFTLEYTRKIITPEDKRGFWSDKKLWDRMNRWLSDKLKDGTADSFPPESIYLFTAERTETKRELTDYGRQRAAENAALQGEAERRMRGYREEMDSRERTVNAALFGRLETDLELAAQGKMDSESYGTSSMYRDMKELEYRQKLEKELVAEEPDEDEYVITSNVIRFDVHFKYMEALKDVLDAVRFDWENNTRDQKGSDFYQLVYPLYAVGHPKSMGSAAKSFGSLLKWMIAAAVGAGMFSVSYRLDDVEMSLVPDLLVFAAGIAGLVLAVAGLILAGKAVYGIMTGIRAGKGKLKKQAKKNAPEIYRQLRYYTLWNKDAGAVKNLDDVYQLYKKYR